MRGYSDKDKKTISDLLLLYRDKRGYSQEELGHRVGCDKSHISNLERRDAKGLSLQLAHALREELRIGEVDPKHPELKAEHYWEWSDATHLTEFEARMERERWARQGQSLLRGVFDRLQPYDYLQLWLRGRLSQLQFNYKGSVPLLENALHKARDRIVPADPDILGIMYYDLAGAHLVRGNHRFTTSLSEPNGFDAAASYCGLATQGYRSLQKQGLARVPNVQLGLARALFQRFDIAVWGGESIEECERLSTEAIAYIQAMKPPDEYGWAKVLFTLGYLYRMEGNLDRAAAFAEEAHHHAQEIIRTWPPNPFESPTAFCLWLLRDGWFLGGHWNSVQCLALRTDVEVERARRDERRPEKPERYFMDRALFGFPWSQGLPPCAPLYSWKFELGNKPKATLNTELAGRVHQLEELGYMLIVPLAMIAYADFLAETAFPSAQVREWYWRALESANSYGSSRLIRLAERRLQEA